MRRLIHGWNKDKPDHRDRLFKLPPHVVISKNGDLSVSACMPPIYDQGQLGSCTANGTKRVVDYERAYQGEPFIDPARLAIYYDTRAMEGNVSSDAGGQIRDAVKVAAKIGVGPESMWPYDISKFAIKPPPSFYAEAIKHQALSYQRVAQSHYGITYVLDQLKRPIVFGCLVFDYFESDQVAQTGLVPMPAPNAQAIGGHCMVIVGFDDVTARYKVANSWGPDWGDKGYCYMPYNYIHNPSISSDFWVVTKEE